MLRLCLIVTLVVLADPVSAQPPDPLPLQARKVLKRYCHGCHSGPGSDSGYRFDVLDRASLLKGFDADEKAVVVPRKLDSRLWVRAGIAKTMPPRSVKERPTDGELDALQQWITAGAPPFPPPKPRTFLSNADMLKAIRADLLAAAPKDRPHRRYFTLLHLHNNPNVSSEDLRAARAALSKALNSLTRSPRITVPKAIDRTETILAIDLRDFEWDKHGLWRAVLTEYPYGLDFKGSEDPDLVQLQKKLDGLTGGELFHIRGDWFVVTATRPPLYYALLQLPKTVDRLESDILGVDFETNFRADKLVRAGFQASGVSTQNRLVERHDAPFGAYYWKSYDFKPRRPRASLVRFSLGPEFPEHPYPRLAFQHDGGEMIFGLPNGLQGYFLSDGKGNRIDEGPTDVVSDALKTSGSPAIVNGTSCMHCHKLGVIGFVDTIRDGTGLFGEAREKVRRLYPEQKATDQLLNADRDRFTRSLDRAIGPFLKVEEDKDRPLKEFGEPIGETARAYLLTDVSPGAAAYELGINGPEPLAGLIRSNPKLKELGLLPLANGKGLKRDDWEAREGTSLFQDTAMHLGIGTPVVNR